MPQSKRKLETICEFFRSQAAQGKRWISLPELSAVADQRQVNLSHSLIGDYVRRHCLNDPSNRTALPKHFLKTPRFVTSDPARKRGRKYRLLSEEERAAFLRDPREDWHTQPYAELSVHYWGRAPQPTKPSAPPHKAAAGKGHGQPDERIKVHELARELRIDHQKVIEVAQRLGAEATLPKSRLDDEVAARIRSELAAKKPATKPARGRAAKKARARAAAKTESSAEPKAAAEPKAVEPKAAAETEDKAAETPAKKSTHRSRKRRATKAAAKTPAPAASKNESHPRQAQHPVAIIDVSNVAREECDEKGRAKLDSFLHLLGQLERDGCKVIAIADANLWGQIDRQEEFKDYCRRGVIKQAPTRTEADAWILEKAHEIGGYIISRDTFRERIARYPGLQERIVPFMVFDGEVMLDPEHAFTKKAQPPAKKKRRRTVRKKPGKNP
jgi:hypothetical protein